jgi:tetratricopeptide (TPR) repeat protein/DNA-binding CsgD family transcriptional regulator
MNQHTHWNLLGSAFLVMLITLFSCKQDVDTKVITTNEQKKLEQCSATFSKARKLQKDQKFDKAIAAFKECLRYESSDKNTVDSLYTLITNSMLQMMNTYQACGRAEECVSCLGKMYDKPLPMISKYCMRDLCSIYAYALYRCERMNEAVGMINKALRLPYHIRTHENLFRDYSYAAAIYYWIPGKHNLLVHYGLLALKESELCRHTSGAQWLLTMLAKESSRKGDVQEAIKLHRRAIRVARQKGDTLGLAYAYSGLSSVYMDCSMTLYADECVTSAIRILNNMEKYPDIMAAIYTKKAQCMYAMQRYDSMNYYLGKAATYCKHLPYDNGQMNIDLTRGLYLTKSTQRASVLQGIALLDSVIAKGVMGTKADAFYIKALACIKLKNEKGGCAMLDSMYGMMHKMEEPFHIEDAYPYALSFYVRRHDTNKILQYAKALSQEYDFNRDRTIARQLADMYVQMRTKNTNQQLSFYRMKANNERLSLIIVVFVAIIVIILITAYSLYKRKTDSIHLLMMSEQLSRLSEQMQKEIVNHKETKGLMAKLLDGYGRRRVDNISAEMLNEVGEKEFKKNFEILYPSFIDLLHQHCSDLGPREILVCMLIALNQNNNQIADILCIAYRSVIVSKHRIKQKMNLSGDDNLDDVINKLFTESTENRISGCDTDQ